MKHTLYSIMLAGGLLLCTAPAVCAAAVPFLNTENPTEAQRKTTARARIAGAKATETTKSTSNTARKSSSLSRRSMLSILGLSESKSVTTPEQRQRQLYAHQRHLQAKARTEARARRARCGKPLL